MGGGSGYPGLKGGQELGVTANRASLGNDGSVLELDSADGCMTL